VACFTDARSWLKRAEVTWSSVAAEQQQECFCNPNSLFYIPGFTLKVCNQEIGLSNTLENGVLLMLQPFNQGSGTLSLVRRRRVLMRPYRVAFN
jgi:hypothetical protein